MARPRQKIEEQLQEMGFTKNVINLIENERESDSNFNEILQAKIAKHYDFIKSKSFKIKAVISEARYVYGSDKLDEMIREYWPNHTTPHGLSFDKFFMEKIQSWVYKNDFYDLADDFMQENKMINLTILTGLMDKNPEQVKDFVETIRSIKKDIHLFDKKIDMAKIADFLLHSGDFDNGLYKQLNTEVLKRISLLDYQRAELDKIKKLINGDTELSPKNAELILTMKKPARTADKEEKYLFSDLSFLDFNNKDRMNLINEKLDLMKEAMIRNRSFVLNNKNIDIFLFMTKKLDPKNDLIFVDKIVENMNKIICNMEPINNKLQKDNLNQLINTDMGKVFKFLTGKSSTGKILASFLDCEQFNEIIESKQKKELIFKFINDKEKNGATAQDFVRVDILKKAIPSINVEDSKFLMDYISNLSLEKLKDLNNQNINLDELIHKKAKEKNAEIKRTIIEEKDVYFLRKLKNRY